MDMMVWVEARESRARPSRGVSRISEASSPAGYPDEKPNQVSNGTAGVHSEKAESANGIELIAVGKKSDDFESENDIGRPEIETADGGREDESGEETDGSSVSIDV